MTLLDPKRPARRPIFPMVALTTVVVLRVAGVSMAAFNERLYAQSAVRQATVQANILADTVAAPLAFDDDQAAQEYIRALAADPSIAAVAIYDETGRPVASFQRGGEDLPARAAPSRPTPGVGGTGLPRRPRRGHGRGHSGCGCTSSAWSMTVRRRLSSSSASLQVTAPVATPWRSSSAMVRANPVDQV